MLRRGAPDNNAFMGPHLSERDASALLTRAAVLLGGVLRLAQLLGVAAEDVLGWIANKAAAPQEILAKATAIADTYDIDSTGVRELKLDALRKPRARLR